MKAKKSKLDPFAERLDEMELQNQTLEQMQSALAGLGCSVSLGRLSVFLERRRTRTQQDALFDKIASGARMNEQLDKAFTKNPPPDIEQMVRVIKVLIGTLQVKGQAEPELLELANAMFKSVLDFAKLETKNAEVDLARMKFQFDATEAALGRLDTLKAIKTDSQLSEDQKLEKARLELFGVAPK